MKKILVPTDFSDYAAKALQYAVQVAKKMGAEIVLMHVFDVLKYPFADKKHLVKEYNETKIAELNIALQRLKDGIEEKEVVITTMLYDGDIVDGILAASQQQRADLIVMGTLGITGLKTLILGTKTAAVIRDSSIPVITIPQDFQWAALKEILIAVNNTKEDIKILEPVFMLSRFFDAKIKTVVFSEEDADADELMEHSIVAREMQNKLEKQFTGYEIETNHLSGNDFHQSIHKYIEKEQIDLLVMITYKRTFMQNLFNFSMTRRMAHHTTIPLLSLQGTV